MMPRKVFMNSGNRIFQKFWRWRSLRWLVLLLVVPPALCGGIFGLYLTTYYLHSLYFDWLDHSHRYALRSASSAVFWLSFSVAFLFVVAILGLGLAAISPGFRRRARTASIVLIGAFLLACLGCSAFVVIRSKPDRQIATAKAVWAANLGSIPSDSNTFAATRLMVFPDARDLVIASPGRLRTLDTRTGEVIANWQFEGQNPYVFASSSGKVVLSAGGELRLLSSHLIPSKISFPVTDGEANRASPSGARIAWQRFSQDPPKTIFLNTDSLRPEETFASCRVETMSDRLVAESVILVNQRSEPAINVCEPGAAEHILYRGSNQPYYSFYLNNELMLMIKGDRLELIDSQGKLLGEDEWPGEELGFAGVSRDGSRFAIATERWGIGDPARINRESIVIYDTSTIRPVLAIHSERVPYLQSLSALSPDGKAIAVSSGSSVRYFRLP
jgi:hypothetical protein